MKDIKDLVTKCVNAVEDKKAENVKLLNISEISSLCDYFLLATGSNISQLQAMADNVSEAMAKENVHPKQTEGYNGGSWILMDYGDFMVHLFSREARDFYNLERVWKDAKVE